MRLTTEEREQLTEGFRKELAGLQAKVDQGAARVAELEQLAQLRGEEVLGRGKELLEFGECTEALVRQLWPGEEAERILESDVCGETRALFARIGERMATLMGERRIFWRPSEVPVDHAYETLAQLEVLLSCDARSRGYGSVQPLGADERWALVAGHIVALVEGQHDQRRRETETVEALGRLQDALSDLQKLTRAQELGQDEANTLVLLNRGALPFTAVAELVQRWEDRHDHEGSPTIRAEIARCARELAAVTVRHVGPGAPGLLGGTALVDEELKAPPRGHEHYAARRREADLALYRAAVEPLNPGEVAECGEAHGYAPHRCSRPAGHEGNHEAGLPWLSSWPQARPKEG